jgi:hypothetical protein
MSVALYDEIERGLQQIVRRDVIEQGAELLRRETAAYGTPKVLSTAEHAAMNYIFSIAGVSYPDRPVTPEVQAAVKIMAIAITIAWGKLTADTLATAVKEIAVFGHRIYSDAHVDDGASHDNALVEHDEEDLDAAGSEAQQILSRLGKHAFVPK